LTPIINDGSLFLQDCEPYPIAEARGMRLVFAQLCST
jgi:hypothetical protein